MPVTDELQLPSYDELDVQDVNISQPVLLASATYFGKYCDNLSKEYMLCKIEEKDPRKCLNEGKALTMCGHEFFRKVGSACKEETERLAKCMEWTQGQLRMFYCNKERKVMDQCMSEKLGMTPPPIGYFSQLRIHDSERPKPKSFATEFIKPNQGVTREFAEQADNIGPRYPIDNWL